MLKRCAILVVLAMLQGCHSYAPLETGVPAVGENHEFQINDRGRFELTDRLGRGLSVIEGRLTGITDEQYVLNVASVSFLSGEKNRWSGESIRLNREYVDRAAVRRLDKKRSWIAASIVVLGVTAFILTRGLLVDFFGETEPPDTTEPPISFFPRLLLPSH